MLISLSRQKTTHIIIKFGNHTIAAAAHCESSYYKWGRALKFSGYIPPELVSPTSFRAWPAECGPQWPRRRYNVNYDYAYMNSLYIGRILILVVWVARPFLWCVALNIFIYYILYIATTNQPKNNIPKGFACSRADYIHV